MAFKPFKWTKPITKGIGEGAKYLKRGAVAIAPLALSALAFFTKNKKLKWLSELTNLIISKVSRPKTKGTPMSVVDQEVKQIARAIIEAQGASPEKLILTIADVLGSAANLYTEFKGKTEAEVAELIKGGIDGCVGSESDALIGGKGSGALVEVAVLDGATLEAGSDIALQLIAEALKKKLA